MLVRNAVFWSMCIKFYFSLWRRPSISAGVLAIRHGDSLASAFTWRRYNQQPCAFTGTGALAPTAIFWHIVCNVDENERQK